MTKFEKIKDIILAYRKKADKHFKNYKEAEKKAREKYSEAGFKQEFMQGVWPEMAGKAWSDKDTAVHELNDVFDEIREGLERWVMKPLDAGTVQILSCIRDFNLDMSLDELRVLESSVKGSYFGSRIFSGLTKKNGYSITIPNMNQLMDALKAARNNAAFSVQAYAGSGSDGFPGTDLLPEWKYNGVAYGEYKTFHLIMAANFLEPDGEIDRLASLWNSINAPAIYRLTSEETEKLQDKVEGIFEKGYGGIDSQKADELLKEIPDIASRLKSADDFPNKKLALDYFTLSDTENQKEEAKKDESKIDVASFAAKEYGTNLGKVDESLLAQYK